MGQTLLTLLMFSEVHCVMFPVFAEHVAIGRTSERKLESLLESNSGWSGRPTHEVDAVSRFRGRQKRRLSSRQKANHYGPKQQASLPFNIWLVEFSTRTFLKSMDISKKRLFVQHKSTLNVLIWQVVPFEKWKCPCQRRRATQIQQWLGDVCLLSSIMETDGT